MFGWFRRYVRKVGIFGVEVEFHAPTDLTAGKPALLTPTQVVLEASPPTKDPWAEGRDPRPLISDIVSAYESGDVAGVLDTKTTIVGREVLKWLVEQKWFDERPPLLVTEKKAEGERSELVGVYKFQDGTEKVALVFFWESGALKFHDVCCFDMKGDRVNMLLSFILKNPSIAGLNFARQNPGKVLGGVLGAVKSVIK